MGNSMDNATSTTKGGCFVSVIGALLSYWGITDYFSMGFGNAFTMAFIGAIIIMIGLGISAFGAVWFTGAATGAAVEAIVEYTINKIIDIFSLKEEIKMRCPSALKAQIVQKKSNAVDVGIYNNSSTMTSKITIKSDEGVSGDLRVGQVIYLNN